LPFGGLVEYGFASLAFFRQLVLQRFVPSRVDVDQRNMPNRRLFSWISGASS
jgi:hypothetical protein